MAKHRVEKPTTHTDIAIDDTYCHSSDGVHRTMLTMNW